MQRAEIFVDGEVQGVGYRYNVRRAARKRKLVGSVENLEDGRVKITCEGEESSIKTFLEDIKIREPPIFVENIEHRFSKPTRGFKGFKIVTGRLEEETVEGFSTGAVYLDTVRTELREFREESKTNFQALRENVIGVKEEVAFTREELGEEIRGLRLDLKSYLDERFVKLEKEIEKIKEKIGIL